MIYFYQVTTIFFHPLTELYSSLYISLTISFSGEEQLASAELSRVLQSIVTDQSVFSLIYYKLLKYKILKKLTTINHQSLESRLSSGWLLMTYDDPVLSLLTTLSFQFCAISTKSIDKYDSVCNKLKQRL